MALLPERSIRLRGFSSIDLGRLVGSKGEVFFDQSNTSLRIMDGQTRGGKAIAAGVTTGDTPPTSPQAGQQWFNTVTGVLYIWYVDVLGGQWIQPVTEPVGVIDEPEEFSLFAATVNNLGGVIIDENSISIDENGIISALFTNSFDSPELLGITTISLPSTSINTLIGSTGVVVHDIGAVGTTFYHVNIISNFTANFTNVSLGDYQSTTIILVLEQGPIAYIPDVLQIDGSPQTINWLNNEIPAGTANDTDIFSLTYNLLPNN
jgi:hypothetical protein